MLLARHLDFEWPNGQIVFKNLNLQLTNQKWAVVGPNGSGKSTLLRVLAAELAPTAGELRIPEGTLYLAQAPNAAPDRSGGEWMMQRLENHFRREPAVLLLDEPTNHLDERHRGVVQRWIRETAAGVLIATHDRELLEAMEGLWWIENGFPHFFPGGYREWRERQNEERMRRDRRLQTAKRDHEREEARRIREREKQEKRVRQGDRLGASGSLPRILIGARQRQAEATSARVKRRSDARVEDRQRERSDAAENRLEESRPYFAWSVEPSPRTGELLAGDELRLLGREGELWREPVHLRLSYGERLWVRGRNGVGKSALLAALAGEELPAGLQLSGRIQNRAFASVLVRQLPALPDDPEASLFSVLRAALELTDQQILDQLARFQFPIAKARSPWRDLSGGERVRAGYASLFMAKTPPELLLLDEPANHLDLVTQEWLSEVLAEFPGTLVIVSHDRGFARSLNPSLELKLQSPEKNAGSGNGHGNLS